ncbi:deoxyribodipyrimidine photo-lyase [Buchnera aphidicola]|uniref:deoxyribodipyrimidine photo-lyase n=1 Tax=Buchnera aphidicola TaxID=9 RepID=UPI0031B8A198
MKIHLMWFRNDLRIHDNTALHFCCKDPLIKVLSIFISTPSQWQKHDMSFKKSEYIYKNLLELKKNMLSLGIPLDIHESMNFATSIQFIIQFCKKNKITDMFYNYEYEINEKKRDVSITQLLNKENILIHRFHDSVILPPDKICTKNGKIYQCFYFFKKNIINQLKETSLKCWPKPNIRNSIKYTKKKIPFTYKREKIQTKIYPIGEEQALNQLIFFIEKNIENYELTYNIPYLNTTSLLSVCLSIGVLSPRQCLYFLFKKTMFTSKKKYQCRWFNELLWREFYKYLLINNPQLSKYESLLNFEKKIKWNSNENHLLAWKNGKTGYPIIDAGMRQLKEYGWIHNRIRMICACFLVKNLLIDWRIGEKYFISKLIDGDLAINNGNWQWIASVGINSMPYFQIFNPINQIKKFDSQGLYIKKYLPELRKVPPSDISIPYNWSYKTGKKINYPIPIIDYNVTKKKFLFTILSAKRSF